MPCSQDGPLAHCRCLNLQLRQVTAARVQRRVCNAVCATPRVQRRVCSTMCATPRVQHHVCNATCATTTCATPRVQQPRVHRRVCNAPCTSPRVQRHVCNAACATHTVSMSARQLTLQSFRPVGMVAMTLGHVVVFRTPKRDRPHSAERNSCPAMLSPTMTSPLEFLLFERCQTMIVVASARGKTHTDRRCVRRARRAAVGHVCVCTLTAVRAHTCCHGWALDRRGTQLSTAAPAQSVRRSFWQ